MRRTLVASPAFVRSAKRSTKRRPEVATSLRDTLSKLEADAFNPLLRTHKLKGELSDRWSCTAGYDLRVVFRFVQQGTTETILLLAVGKHDEVY